MKKSNTSGILNISAGQCVGDPVDSELYRFFVMQLMSSFPLGLVRRDPHHACFALKSPPTKNLLPILLKNRSY